MTSEEVARKFVKAINEADAARLADLMIDEHVFIDSDGTATRGRTVMQEAWSRFFPLMPRYRVEVRETFCRENTVVLVGVATGGDNTGPVAPWSVPAAWRAVVEGHRVACWQVFVNPQPMLAALAPDAVRAHQAQSHG